MQRSAAGPGAKCRCTSRPRLARAATLLITMGCGEVCPAVPGLRRLDWPLEDPKGKELVRVRQIRDEVRERVLQLLAAEGWARESATSAP
jgi:arsenate reductase